MQFKYFLLISLAFVYGASTEAKFCSSREEYATERDQILLCFEQCLKQNDIVSAYRQVMLLKSLEDDNFNMIWNRGQFAVKGFWRFISGNASDRMSTELKRFIELIIHVDSRELIEKLTVKDVGGVIKNIFSDNN
jgi:hypothetical protein